VTRRPGIKFGGPELFWVSLQASGEKTSLPSSSATNPPSGEPVNGIGGGVGTVDAVTANGGTVAPGGSSPGILTVGGVVAFNPATTLNILLNGIDAGTGYSQLAAGGPIDLSGSSPSLTFGFEPPVGSTFEIFVNTGSGPVVGTFNGLDEGAISSLGGYQFQITYQGGTGGNSVLLTRLA
jgi:hypothetical protein